MKRSIFIFLIFTSIFNLNAQRFISYDTIQKHEISVSVLPVLNYFSGSFPQSEYVNFNFSYKCYFKNKFVARAAVVYFPRKNGLSSYDGAYVFDRTIFEPTGSVKNIFSLYYSNRSEKWQFNLGLEKIVKTNRLMHGFGCEIFVNKWQENFKKNYEYRYVGQSINLNFTDTTNYSVDSLNTKSTSKFTGVGLQVFYSMRYQISKRWYVSTTIGPSLAYIFASSSQYKNSTGKTTDSKSSQFYFPNVGFISDISICFRL